MSDESLDANWASGAVDLGHPMTLTREDRDLALIRASTQAIGTNRKDLHALQPQWRCPMKMAAMIAMTPWACAAAVSAVT